MKTCTNCKIEKSTDDFYKQKASKDGLHPYCKVCSSERNKRNYQKRWSYYRERGNAANRAAYAADPQKKLAQNAAWSAANKDKVAVILRRYYERHPEMRAKKHSMRRARKENNGVFVILPKELRKLKTQPCIYCGAKAEHMDHITPISRGGRHSVGNLAPACAKCNLSKNNKFIVEWKASVA